MPAVLENPTQIRPVTGESQADFIDRVWNSAPGDTDVDKARFCRDAWFSVRDGDLARIADRRFPADQYRRVTGSAVFKEHTTKRMVHDPQTGLGREQPVVYDRSAIEAIADRCNRRIKATGDFSPLTEGHTPDKDMLSRGARQPEVLGYAGPYYLGKLAGQWAIFCDEHHNAADLRKLDKLQRRSPEVWMEDRMDDRFFDPIACLGAETPRLDLGMTRYGRYFETTGADGAQLMKYAAPAAMPGGSNTFLPKDHYQSEQEDGGMTSPEDVQAIVQAISETEPFQAMQRLAPVVDKLLALVPAEDQEHGGLPAAPPAAPSPAAPPPAASAPPAAPAKPPGPQVPPPAHPPAKKNYEADDEDRDMLRKYMSGDCDDAAFNSHMSAKKAKYMAEGSAADEAAAKAPTQGTVTESYSRSREKADLARYQRENIELRQRLDQVEGDRRHAMRYSALQSKMADGYIFDLDEELKDTADMTDDQFSRHLQRIEKYERAPLGTAVPDLVVDKLDRTSKEKEQYQKQRRDEIQKLARAKGLGWDAAATEWDAAHPAA